MHRVSLGFARPCVVDAKDDGGRLRERMRVFGGPQEREDGHLTEWDRFARAEYVRLSMEEEGDDGGGTDMLEDSLDAPF